LVVVDALAPGTRQLVGARLVPVVEEVAFVERHEAIINPSWRATSGCDAAHQTDTTSRADIGAFRYMMAAILPNEFNNMSLINMLLESNDVSCFVENSIYLDEWP
jgi:hypothetical protein